jgi:hypothetical protein
VSPEEHLRQAREAFNGIKATSIPARNRAQFTELRRHLAALENSPAAGASAKTPSRSAKTDNWGTDVAAIDRILTNLVGSDTATATSASTTGATGTAGRSATASSAAVDEATRAKLMEIRTHITAYAAAKAGSSSPRSDAAAMPNETSAAQAATPAAGDPAQSQQPNPAQSQQPNPAQTPQPNPAENPQAPAQTMPAQPSAAPQAAGTPKVDAEAAHRELLAARDSLNQLTQLPAAAQLAGDARTQVQQVISNFNELITNTSDWRASYAKVEASLNALLGPENSTATTTTPTETPQPAQPPQPTPSTPGAVGTSGTAPQLDPAIRAKLVEMRNHLSEFAKASGGGK